MAYSLDSLKDDCYPGTTVLINKLDIRNEKLLAEAEQTITAINYAQIENEFEFVDVDFEYYKNIHKRLFYDIYEWAGMVRSVNLSKKGTAFCEYKEISELAEKRFGRLKRDNFLVDLDFETFVDEFTDLYVDLNYLHPFREGNGRTHRLFLTLLVWNAGYSIDFSQCDLDMLMIATIKSAQGDAELLRTIISELIKPEMWFFISGLNYISTPTK